jgi:phosphohistidine phosphatase
MGPLRLTLFRHGQAQPVHSCPEDFERALTRRGINEAREMASRLARRGLIPDLILASPAERTWATASILAGILELDGTKIQGVRELYLATPETTWQVLTGVEWGAVHLLVCGHNPGLSHIASRFGPAPEPRELATAGFASAAWTVARWHDLEPETAVECELDDPQNMADLWT